MKIAVGTTEVELDATDYPDTGGRGQVLILQNLGTGDIYFDFAAGVTATTGIKVAAGGGYEISNFGPGVRIFVIATAASTDLRYAVAG